MGIVLHEDRNDGSVPSPRTTAGCPRARFPALPDADDRPGYCRRGVFPTRQTRSQWFDRRCRHRCRARVERTTPEGVWVLPELQALITPTTFVLSVDATGKASTPRDFQLGRTDTSGVRRTP